MTSLIHDSKAGYLLAGGRSSRMGSDKAFLEFRGETLIDRSLRVLRSVCEDVTIVGDPATFHNYSQVVQDRVTGCGPLGGIYTALSTSDAELNVILAVDMPFVSEELLRYLLDFAGKNKAEVTIPQTTAGWQPLCAIYRPAFAPLAKKAIERGDYKIDHAFSESTICAVREDDLIRAGFSEHNFINLNTPEDRAAAENLRP